MSKFIIKNSKVDIIFLAEGTYPFVRGGVSSWIHQIISSLSEYSFGIIFIGSKKEDYGEILYELPPNLLHLEVHYLFDDIQNKPIYKKGNKKAFKAIKELHESFDKESIKLHDMIKEISFFEKKLTYQDFLYSKRSWKYISLMYEKNAPDISFVDYFWTVRNIHAPIWKVAKVARDMPKCKILHSPSTGYAGLLGSLASIYFDTPFILTEHGIYTKERKIDLLSAKWIKFSKSSLIKEKVEELNYVKKMWVNFFEQIGKFSYSQAKYIISLYKETQKVQISYGADKNRCIVIPNGIDLDRFNSLVFKRESKIPQVVTLIGRVVPIKDIKTFIRAIAIAKLSIANIVGLIVGPTDEDKEYAKECFEMVKLFNLNQNIQFLGHRRVDDILPKSGILTLTSISEGMPLVVLEAFAAGVVCVTTDVGSCKDLIYGALDQRDIEISKAGEVVPIADSSALAKSYIKFLTNERLYKQAQKSALTRVKLYYQDKMFLNKYRKIYKEFI